MDAQRDVAGFTSARQRPGHFRARGASVPPLASSHTGALRHASEPRPRRQSRFAPPKPPDEENLELTNSGTERVPRPNAPARRFLLNDAKTVPVRASIPSHSREPLGGRRVVVAVQLDALQQRSPSPSPMIWVESVVVFIGGVLARCRFSHPSAYAFSSLLVGHLLSQRQLSRFPKENWLISSIRSEHQTSCSDSDQQTLDAAVFSF